MKFLQALLGGKAFGENARVTHHFTPEEMMQAIATAYTGDGRIRCIDVVQAGVIIERLGTPNPRLFGWCEIMERIQLKFKCLTDGLRYDVWMDSDGLHIAELR